MDLAHLAAVILLVSSPGDAVLLDFRADYCGPCRQMDPLISQMAAEGFPVRTVNVDQQENRELASRFGIGPIPCFVMVAGGKEVGRITGATSRQSLEALFAKAGIVPGQTARGQSPDVAETAREAPRDVPFPRANQAAGATREQQYDHLIRASVRLRIEDTRGNSRGSGTVIDAREGEALILTCGHVFRDAAKNGRIWVDLFGPDAPQGLPGRLVAYDLDSDVGLLSVETNYPVMVAHLAPEGFKLNRGDRVVSIGCDGGADATARETQITSINRYLQPKSNIQVAFQPVQGRSGGGLFTPEGWVIGVCNAADPQDNEGLFAGLEVVQEQLDKVNLSFIYRDMPAGQHAVADGRLHSVAEISHGDRRDRQWPPIGAGSREMAAGVPTSEFVAGPRSTEPLQPQGAVGSSGSMTDEERATLEMLHAKSRNAEVICIIRPRDNPGAKSEIIVLDRVSDQFAQNLGAGREPAATQQQLTSMQTPRPSPAPTKPASQSRGPLKLKPWWADAMD